MFNYDVIGVSDVLHDVLQTDVLKYACIYIPTDLTAIALYCAITFDAPQTGLMLEHVLSSALNLPKSNHISALDFW